jgi:hypothetical protein
VSVSAIGSTRAFWAATGRTIAAGDVASITMRTPELVGASIKLSVAARIHEARCFHAATAFVCEQLGKRRAREPEQTFTLS